MSSPETRRLSKTTSRVTARLGRHLEKNLLAYTTAASAGLLLALPAEAEIIYTPSNTPMAIASRNQGPALTQLDLNNDGKPDFTFGMSYTSLYNSSTVRFKFFLKVVPHQKGNEAVQGQEAPTAAAVAAGEIIGPQQKFASGGLYMAIKQFGGRGSRSSGTWRKVEVAYLGLKIVINGQVHYGWARIKFPYPGSYGYPSIYGYAYESTPNQPIVAGQTSGTAKETAAGAPGNLGMLAAGASGVDLWRGRSSADDVR